MFFIPGAVFTTEHIHKSIKDGPGAFALHGSSIECVISGFRQTRVCDPRLYANLFLSSLQELCSTQIFPQQLVGPNCSSRAWNLRGWSLQDSRAIPLRCVRITCNQMTTPHNILSGLSVVFVFMYVCTLSKPNEIFFFDKSHVLMTCIPNQSLITSSDYHRNGCLINHKIMLA